MNEIERFGKKFKIENNLVVKLDVMLQRISRDWDNVIIITGMPGIGKSESLAFAIGWYLSGKKVHITFDYDQFAKAFDTGNPGDTIICDEFLTVGMGTQAMTKKQNYTKLKMTTGRKKNYNIVLVCEDLYELQRYFVKRSICLIHAFSPNLLDRGDFAYFNYEQKRIMYDIYRGQKKIIDFKFKDFYGHYPHYAKDFFYDNASYQKLKDAVIESIGKEDNKKEKKEGVLVKKYRDLLVFDLMQKSKLGYTYREIGRYYGIMANEVATLVSVYRKDVELTSTREINYLDMSDENEIKNCTD